MAIFAAAGLCVEKRVWCLIYRYMRRGIGRPADRRDNPRELHLYGHVSGACQRRRQIENYTVKTRHVPIRPDRDD